MLWQRDYILRMIHQMGEFLRRLKETLNDLDRQAMLGDLCREKCGIALETADGLDEKSLGEMLPPEPRLILSELYYIRALHTRLLPEEARAFLGRSARLLLSLKEESLVCRERCYRLHDLEADAALTPAEYLDAFAFYLEAEAFDWAEDALFFALEEGAGGLEEGLRGFMGLRALSDQRLTAGGLPRQELEELIHTLQARI